MKYYQIRFTIDERILGKHNDPHTIEIKSKDFLKYHLEKFLNIRMYFENRKTLYEDMPDNLKGKLLEQWKTIDFMNCSPACLSLEAVISDKMKQILERLNISKNEYVLKRISIKWHPGDFYLLFIPIIPDTEFVYPKCVFREMFGENNIKLFNTREEYYNDPEYYDLPKLTLKDKYRNYDLLSPQASGCFFSERVINAMREENIVGYDIVTGGCFYTELNFADE